MSEETTKDSHESFGLFSAHRVHGTRQSLFGSSIEHHNTIRLTISRATHLRDLSHDWYHADKELIEIEMSPSQWAEAITCMNMGVGVPCTLLYVNGERMKDCPKRSERQVFNKEFDKKIRDITKKFAQGIEKVRAILEKKSLTKADRIEIMNIFSLLEMELGCNVPFVQHSFSEAMDKTVASAKGEVEAFIMNAVLRTGLTALLDSKPVLGLPDGEAIENEAPEESQR